MPTTGPPPTTGSGRPRRRPGDRPPRPMERVSVDPDMQAYIETWLDLHRQRSNRFIYSVRTALARDDNGLINPHDYVFHILRAVSILHWSYREAEGGRLYTIPLRRRDGTYHDVPVHTVIEEYTRYHINAFLYGWDDFVSRRIVDGDDESYPLTGTPEYNEFVERTDVIPDAYALLTRLRGNRAMVGTLDGERVHHYEYPIFSQDEEDRREGLELFRAADRANEYSPIQQWMGRMLEAVYENIVDNTGLVSDLDVRGFPANQQRWLLPHRSPYWVPAIPNSYHDTLFITNPPTEVLVRQMQYMWRLQYPESEGSPRPPLPPFQVRWDERTGQITYDPMTLQLQGYIPEPEEGNPFRERAHRPHFHRVDPDRLTVTGSRPSSPIESPGGGDDDWGGGDGGGDFPMGGMGGAGGDFSMGDTGGAGGDVPMGDGDEGGPPPPPPPSAPTPIAKPAAPAAAPPDLPRFHTYHVPGRLERMPGNACMFRCFLVTQYYRRRLGNRNEYLQALFRELFEGPGSPYQRLLPLLSDDEQRDMRRLYTDLRPGNNWVADERLLWLMAYHTGRPVILFNQNSPASLGALRWAHLHYPAAVQAHLRAVQERSPTRPIPIFLEYRDGNHYNPVLPDPRTTPAQWAAIFRDLDAATTTGGDAGLIGGTRDLPLRRGWVGEPIHGRSIHDPDVLPEHVPRDHRDPDPWRRLMETHDPGWVPYRGATLTTPPSPATEAGGEDRMEVEADAPFVFGRPSPPGPPPPTPRPPAPAPEGGWGEEDLDIEVDLTEDVVPAPAPSPPSSSAPGMDAVTRARFQAYLDSLNNPPGGRGWRDVYDPNRPGASPDLPGEPSRTRGVRRVMLAHPEETAAMIRTFRDARERNPDYRAYMAELTRRTLDLLGEPPHRYNLRSGSQNLPVAVDLPPERRRHRLPSPPPPVASDPFVYPPPPPTSPTAAPPPTRRRRRVVPADVGPPAPPPRGPNDDDDDDGPGDGGPATRGGGASGIPVVDPGPPPAPARPSDDRGAQTDDSWMWNPPAWNALLGQLEETQRQLLETQAVLAVEEAAARRMANERDTIRAEAERLLNRSQQQNWARWMESSLRELTRTEELHRAYTERQAAVEQIRMQADHLRTERNDLMRRLTVGAQQLGIQQTVIANYERQRQAYEQEMQRLRTELDAAQQRQRHSDIGGGKGGGGDPAERDRLIQHIRQLEVAMNTANEQLRRQDETFRSELGARLQMAEQQSQQQLQRIQQQAEQALQQAQQVRVAEQMQLRREQEQLREALQKRNAQLRAVTEEGEANQQNRDRMWLDLQQRYERKLIEKDAALDELEMIVRNPVPIPKPKPAAPSSATGPSLRERLREIQEDEASARTRIDTDQFLDRLGAEQQQSTQEEKLIREAEIRAIRERYQRLIDSIHDEQNRPVPERSSNETQTPTPAMRETGTSTPIPRPKNRATNTSARPPAVDTGSQYVPERSSNETQTLPPSMRETGSSTTPRGRPIARPKAPPASLNPKPPPPPMGGVTATLREALDYGTLTADPDPDPSGPSEPRRPSLPPPRPYQPPTPRAPYVPFSSDPFRIADSRGPGKTPPSAASSVPVVPVNPFLRTATVPAPAPPPVPVPGAKGYDPSGDILDPRRCRHRLFTQFRDAYIGQSRPDPRWPGPVGEVVPQRFPV